MKNITKTALFLCLFLIQLVVSGQYTANVHSSQDISGDTTLPYLTTGRLYRIDATAEGNDTIIIPDATNTPSGFWAEFSQVGGDTVVIRNVSDTEVWTLTGIGQSVQLQDIGVTYEILTSYGFGLNANSIDTAKNVFYDNTISGLDSSHVQGAIDQNAVINATALQNEYILGALLNNGFFESHEFEVVIDGGVVYMEVWSSANGYEPGDTYNRGNQVIYNNMRYFSKTDLNSGNQPDISPDDWEQISLADFNLHGFIEGSNRVFNLNTTTGSGIDGHARIALTAGTDAVSVTNWVYAEMNGTLDLELAASTTKPSTPVILLGYAEIASVATTNSQGTVNIQRYNNGLYREDLFKGQEETIRNKARHRVTYEDGSGVDPLLTVTVNGGAIDNAVITTTDGITQQFWEQVFPAQSGTPVFYVMNHPTNPVTQQYTDLNELDVDANGVTLRNNNDRYGLRIWGNQTSGTNTDDALYVTLPTGKYNTDVNALNDFSDYDVTAIDDKFIHTFFNICRVVLRYQTGSSGTLINLVGGSDVQDKRGEIIGSTGGSGGAVSSQVNFSDAEWKLHNATDVTKELVTDLSGISTATTHTWTVEDISGRVLIDGTNEVATFNNDIAVNGGNAVIATSAENAILEIHANSTTFSPQTVYKIQGASKFTAGVDNSDGDSYKISVGATIGTGNALKIDASLNTTLTGTLAVEGTTESTSTITGAIQTDGGLGVVKNANIGGTLTVDEEINIDGPGDSYVMGPFGVGSNDAPLETFHVFDDAPKTASSNIALFGSSEATQPMVLQIRLLGSATASERGIAMDATERGVSSDRALILQEDGGGVFVGTTAAVGSELFGVDGDVYFNGDVVVTGNITTSGGEVQSVVTKTSDYTLTGTERNILVDATANTVTISLDASPVHGQVYDIFCTNSTFTCTVARNGNTINGAAADQTLLAAGSIEIQWDDSYGWFIKQ